MWPAAVVQHAATGMMLQPIYNLNSLLSERWNTSVAPDRYGIIVSLLRHICEYLLKPPIPILSHYTISILS
jgi:hypothetical protein